MSVFDNNATKDVVEFWDRQSPASAVTGRPEVCSEPIVIGFRHWVESRCSQKMGGRAFS